MRAAGRSSTSSATRKISRSSLVDSAALPTDNVLLVSPEAGTLGIGCPQKRDFVSTRRVGPAAPFVFLPVRGQGIRHRATPNPPCIPEKHFGVHLQESKPTGSGPGPSAVLGIWSPTQKSPMEVKVAMLMCLPRRYGGGAVPLPGLGFSAGIPPIADRERPRMWERFATISSGQASISRPRSDDSDAVHAATEKLFRDARRRNIIQALGVTSLSLTRGQVMHEAAFEEFIRELYSMQGIRDRIPTAQHKAAQRKLRMRLFDVDRREEVLRELRR